MNTGITDPGKGVFVNLPTLNEGQVIRELLEGIHRVLEPLSYTICVIDDGSTDGTIGCLEEFSKNRGHLYLIRRQKHGYGCQRGRAIKDALRWGVANTGHELFVEMDGDGSHRPEELMTGLRMLADHDVVIASKYLPGGMTVKRELFRRFVSRFCTRYLQLLLGLSVSDFSNGYRFYNRRAAELATGLRSRYGSPVYLSEVLAYWVRAGMRIGEFPSTYIGRPFGSSKVRLLNHLWAFVAVLEISWRFHMNRFRVRPGEQGQREASIPGTME